MKLRMGMIVAVEFADHVEGGSSPAKFTVYGRLSKINKIALCVDTWCYTNKKTPYDTNVVRYTIVRGAILNINILERVKCHT